MGDAPVRTANTMSDAIALSSPSGRMSKRARAAAEKRLADALFGSYIPVQFPPQPSKAENLRRTAARLRDLAARGMRPRANVRDAAAMEAEAARLEAEAA